MTVTVGADTSVLDEIANAIWQLVPKGRVQVRRHSRDCVALDAIIHGDRVAFDLVMQANEIRLMVFGRTHSARTLVRSLIASGGRRLQRDGQKHVLKIWSPADYGQVAKEANALIDSFIKSAAWRSIESRTEVLGRGEVPAFWWDGRVNFGDLIGPWLVSSLTGKRPVNVRGSLAHPGAIMSVGSVINMLERPGYHIWGSGLLSPLDGPKVRRLRARKPTRITAVRGHLTRREIVSGLGWDVPEVLGDPALLLPRIFEPTPARATGGVIFLPHYKHKALLPEQISDDIATVDVEQEAAQVVNEIASASHVLATSLHGLIVAQAYGVPWTWVQIEGNGLAGDRFKFEDFFSTLDDSAVRRMALTPDEISAGSLRAAARHSALPKTLVDLDRLWDAFPHDAVFGKRLRRAQLCRSLTGRAGRLAKRLAAR